MIGAGVIAGEHAAGLVAVAHAVAIVVRVDAVVAAVAIEVARHRKAHGSQRTKLVQVECAARASSESKRDRGGIVGKVVADEIVSQADARRAIEAHLEVVIGVACPANDHRVIATVLVVLAGGAFVHARHGHQVVGARRGARVKDADVIFVAGGLVRVCGLVVVGVELDGQHRHDALCTELAAVRATIRTTGRALGRDAAWITLKQQRRTVGAGVDDIAQRHVVAVAQVEPEGDAERPREVERLAIPAHARTKAQCRHERDLAGARVVRRLVEQRVRGRCIGETTQARRTRAQVARFALTARRAAVAGHDIAVVTGLERPLEQFVATAGSRRRRTAQRNLQREQRQPPCSAARHSAAALRPRTRDLHPPPCDGDDKERTPEREETRQEMGLPCASALARARAGPAAHARWLGSATQPQLRGSKGRRASANRYEPRPGGLVLASTTRQIGAIGQPCRAAGRRSARRSRSRAPAGRTVDRTGRARCDTP